MRLARTLGASCLLESNLAPAVIPPCSVASQQDNCCGSALGGHGSSLVAFPSPWGLPGAQGHMLGDFGHDAHHNNFASYA